MAEITASERDANAIDEAMARRLTVRRLAQPERSRTVGIPGVERRQVCGYCFQHGEHQTPAACLRALER